MTEGQVEPVPFSLREHGGDGVAVLAPVGELDVATTAQVDARIEAVTGALDELVLDLRGLTFMDSSGLRTVLLAQQRCRAASTSLAIVAGGAAQRVVEISQLQADLPLRAPGELSPAAQQLLGDAG